MKNKILFIIGIMATGGKERQLVEIVNNLDGELYETQMIIKEIDKAYHYSIDKSKCKIYNVNWIGYSKMSYFNAIKYIKTIVEVVKNFKPDIVVSFSKEFSYIYSISTLFIRNKPKLINLSIRDAPLNKGIKHKFHSMMYNYYNVVIANSKAGLLAYNQTNKKNRFVLYNGFNRDKIPKKSKKECRDYLSLPKDSFIVTFVAKQDRRKDHRTFFKAVKNCLSETKKIIFIVVGEGSESESNKEFAKEIGVFDKIVFAGMSSKVEYYLKAADINVLISANYHGEGIPNTILESFACGTPVIATDNGGTKEILSNNTNGILIKHSDCQTLSKEIISLYHDKERLNKYSKEAQRTFNINFETTSMIRNFEQILNSII